MPARWITGAFLLLFAILAGCGKDDKVVGPKPAEITGNWSATKLEYVMKAAPFTRVDLISEGATASCAIRADQGYLLLVTDTLGVTDTTAGTWRIDEDQFMVTPTGSQFDWVWQARLSASTLTLTGADTWYDFDGEGDYEPSEEADNNMTLVR
jgi:hypothetical protein